ncbi:Phosphatidylinositolglycan class N-domain-containing protein [Gloeopeniophorella convolvens]|nr:Phosphatidylinositolglycan class N-domain-containing protein [Gloeopeniophorella convolvens]
MTESSGSIARLLALGIVFHLIYIGTVFDCYFTSPVVHGMRPHKLPQAQAQRLVLIVGDGLRADFVFSANATQIVPGVPERVAPYLRDIVERRGAYGISHTRVPTESRPGHVAIIGGMYEDVSAVTKVDFDSVFNQSSHTFSFGSPDILPMFARGATPGTVDEWSYHEDDEDFTKDATALDIWVLDQLKSLLHNATTDKALDTQLRAPQVVFFLHLLGLDTTGHSYRPHSKEYMNNVLVVDDIVRQTEQLISEFYGDEETSYIFTADHGMSRIGNHGDGDPDNTRTPLIVWGSGIRGPKSNTAASQTPDEYSAPWELQHLARHDVEQADIAALMSALLGTHWPINSVGVLPDINPDGDGYLEIHGGERAIAEAGVVNAKVVLEHYRIKHETELKRTHAILYKPYKYLDPPTSASEYPGSQRISYIESLISTGDFRNARQHTHELIKTTLEGLRYLETYDRTLVRTIVTFAYTGWIAFSAVVTPLWIPIVFNLTVPVLCIFFAIQRLPWTFHIYILFPVYFWQDVAMKIASSSTFQWRKLNAVWIARPLVGLILAVAALQSMVVGYTHRAIWSAGFVAIGLVWPLTSWPAGHWRLLLPWSAVCLLTAVFPLLRVDPSEDLPAIPANARCRVLGGACMLLVGGLAVLKISERESPAYRLASAIQLFLIIFSTRITISSVRSLQAKLGLPLFNQVSGWIVFALATLLPFLSPGPATAQGRLLRYFLTFCPCFIILSIRVEVEGAVRQPQLHKPRDDNKQISGWNPRGLRPDDVRIALFFLFFVQVGFFGTGNVASVSSFYLEPVYRLVPTFMPFLMSALLLFKLLAPFVFLSAAFVTLNARLGMPPFTLFLVALSLTDVMTMTFFFNVTDTGERAHALTHTKVC